MNPFLQLSPITGDDEEWNTEDQEEFADGSDDDDSLANEDVDPEPVTAAPFAGIEKTASLAQQRQPHAARFSVQKQ